MVKRGRDEGGALHGPQQAKHENPVKAPPPKRCRDTPVGGGAAGNGRVSLEKGRQEPDAKWVAREAVSAQVVPFDGADARAEWDASGSAAGELPRWWQLWVGRGGGRVVDCEELLWGWFPFVDEDFSADGEKVGWFSIWGDEVEGQQQEDIWQPKQMNVEIPSRSR
ncbi:hypothetical protein Taro_035072 [Colocasia esculenta]|uniref:Uncharacterized protein n=1 Tax=Colocasia esculenta TaxID=4460 RepID=A0A843W5M1_COLES|nr:hypothetical protein [Colocasia esculenta]